MVSLPLKVIFPISLRHPSFDWYDTKLRILLQLNVVFFNSMLYQKNDGHWFHAHSSFGMTMARVFGQIFAWHDSIFISIMLDLSLLGVPAILESSHYCKCMHFLCRIYRFFFIDFPPSYNRSLFGKVRVIWSLESHKCSHQVWIMSGFPPTFRENLDFLWRCNFLKLFLCHI